MDRQSEHFDAIVVGSGPGGATVARHIPKKGWKVLILKCGYDFRKKYYSCTSLGALRYADRTSPLFYQREVENHQTVDGRLYSKNEWFSSSTSGYLQSTSPQWQ